MMHELVAFYEARLAEKEACGEAVQATKYGRLALSATAISREVAAARDFIENLRGNPRLQAGEESDPCGAGQGQAIRRQADRRLEQTRES
jgi:hypothetical protein